jgi:hypothetical protein
VAPGAHVLEARPNATDCGGEVSNTTLSAAVTDGHTYDLQVPVRKPGIYALCWRHEAWSNFSLSPIGSLAILGPTALGLVEGAIGDRLTLVLTGTGLSSTNLMVVAAGACARASPLGYEGLGAVVPPKPSGSTFDFATGFATDFATFDFGTPIEGTPGSFALCWSHDEAADFVRVGTVLLAAETPKTDFVAASMELTFQKSDYATLIAGRRLATLSAATATAVAAGLADFLSLHVSYVEVTSATIETVGDNAIVSLDFRVQATGARTETVGRSFDEEAETLDHSRCCRFCFFGIMFQSDVPKESERNENKGIS